MGWTAWIAAIGGLLVLLGEYAITTAAGWMVPLGGILALIFGIWAAISK